MTILQILFGLGILGIAGFGFYWVAVLFGAGPKATQKQIENDPPSLQNDRRT